jgi:hypothetical protein
MVQSPKSPASEAHLLVLAAARHHAAAHHHHQAAYHRDLGKPFVATLCLFSPLFPVLPSAGFSDSQAIARETPWKI